MSTDGVPLTNNIVISHLARQSSLSYQLAVAEHDSRTSIATSPLPRLAVTMVTYCLVLMSRDSALGMILTYDRFSSSVPRGEAYEGKRGFDTESVGLIRKAWG
jgi:hypothetical protein